MKLVRSDILIKQSLVIRDVRLKEAGRITYAGFMEGVTCLDTLHSVTQSSVCVRVCVRA